VEAERAPRLGAELAHRGDGRTQLVERRPRGGVESLSGHGDEHRHAVQVVGHWEGELTSV
jgi:hypothetical protein